MVLNVLFVNQYLLKNCYLYKNPQHYLLFDINRIIYESENFT